MKVKDLIVHLSALDPEADIFVCYDGQISDPDFVLSRSESSFCCPSKVKCCAECSVYLNNSFVHCAL